MRLVFYDYYSISNEGKKTKLLNKLQDGQNNDLF